MKVSLLADAAFICVGGGNSEKENLNILPVEDPSVAVKPLVTERPWEPQAQVGGSDRTEAVLRDAFSLDPNLSSPVQIPEI